MNGVDKVGVVGWILGVLVMGSDRRLTMYIRRSRVKRTQQSIQSMKRTGKGEISDETPDSPIDHKVENRATQWNMKPEEGVDSR